jgi:hypothetical protein
MIKVKRGVTPYAYLVEGDLHEAQVFLLPVTVPELATSGNPVLRCRQHPLV